MDFLDEPLHLLILTSIADNIAAAGPSDAAQSVNVLIQGLPDTEGSDGADLEDWDEYEINHAISFAHYAASLPSTSPALADTFVTLKKLLHGLLGGSGPYGADEAAQRLAVALLTAILRVGVAIPNLAADAIEQLEYYAERLGKMTAGEASPDFVLHLLAALHDVLLMQITPKMDGACLLSLLKSLISLVSPDNLVKFFSGASTSAAVTPLHFVTGQPAFPSTVLALVLETCNALLAASLTLLHSPGALPPSDDSAYILHAALDSLSSTAVEVDRLGQVQGGQEAITEQIKLVQGWWNDLIGAGLGGEGSLTRRNSFAVDDEDEALAASNALLMLTLLSLHTGSHDEAHVARIKQLLSETSSVNDITIIKTGFLCAQIAVRNAPELAITITHHIRRFLASPALAFEAEVTCGSGSDIPDLVLSAAKCLATCVQLAPGDDLISSTLYSLLNNITHGVQGTSLHPGGTGNGAHSVRSAPHFAQDTFGKADGATVRTVGTGPRSDEQRRLVGMTTVGVVAHLALEVGREDVIHLAISLLVQRLRAVDHVTEASIVNNLVPLALAGSKSDLVEVFRALSLLARSSHPEDSHSSANSVLAAQTKLARGLAKRLDCCDAYLLELLSLFEDKGTQAQMVAAAGAPKEKEKSSAYSEGRLKDLKASLSALLIPIAALLSHDEYQPQVNAPAELVAHFRNLWFLCTVFGFTGEKGAKTIAEVETAALSAIAIKTPPLIVESANDYVGSDLEYNSILRKDFAHTIHSKQRSVLMEYLPKGGHDVKTMTVAQLTLLAAIHDLEEMRTRQNRPSAMLHYFANDSVNQSSLIGSLEAIATKISRSFLKQLSTLSVTHSLPPSISEEVCKMLVACTHRFRKVREVALRYLRAVLESFSGLMCDRKVVFTLLELLTLMRRSCELQYTDEYSPTFEFRSDKMDLSLEITDDYSVRNEIVSQLHGAAIQWLTLAISRAPIEVQSILQRYLVESRDVLIVDSVEMGAGLAMQFAKSISKVDRQESLMPNIGGWPSDSANLLASQFAAKNYYTGELSGARFVLEQGLRDLQKDSPAESSQTELLAFKSQLANAVENSKSKTKPLSVPEIRRLLLRAVSVLIASPNMDSDIMHYLVSLPITIFTPLAIAAGVDAWTWLISERPEAQIALLGEISAGWLSTIRNKKGLFSNNMDYDDPFAKPVEYTPSDKKTSDLEIAKAQRLLKPHLLLVQVLSSQFHAVKYREPGIMLSLCRLVLRSLRSPIAMSTHALAREVRFSLLLFGFQILASSRMEALLELRFRDRLFNAAFGWFSVRPQWSFGSDRIQVGAEIKLLNDFMAAVQNDRVRGDHSTSSLSDRSPALLVRGAKTLHDYATLHNDRLRLLQLLVENEITRLAVWYNPVNDPHRAHLNVGALEKSLSPDEWSRLIRRAWDLLPAMAVHMGERFKGAQVQAEISKLVRADPRSVLHVAEALHFLLGDKLEVGARRGLQYLPLWAPVPPVTALVYFHPRYQNHPAILQYAMRVLEQHPVDLTFFFVPQVVQALRSDALGYVEEFIFETSKISQLFCHQIIWNMKANTHREDEGEDPMKPALDRMVDNIVGALSGEARAFYDKEFSFFNEVTSISGKLKPFIKKSKPEKKAKIDEEMAKIDVSVGVYLPSNPDGEVIDIDKKSGRPLQSHAKAPFMATFKVRKERLELPSNTSVEVSDDAQLVKTKYDVWLSAIFKVGDDCRQDVLALQIIAMFKNVFSSVGLTLYLFPYRVTATAPGCGVIDVVPNATSRDEMGRAKINDLFSYFVDKYGSVDTVAFQKARLNFIQSMAAYSLACYILQIKDRHNGNVMIDADGHIVHIDFGFLFDIASPPGGIKFEPNSFKLNHEMVVLMGGKDSQGYQMFTELTVKAFLAIRPHADQLCDAVHLMLGTALPSFKGEPTITRLKERFQLQLNERAAADYMMGIINSAYENFRSDVYAAFQKFQNGIPY